MTLSFNNIKNKAIGLSTSLGSTLGYIYGGPIAATCARAGAATFIPAMPTAGAGITGGAKALLWNMHRKTAIEHIGFQAFRVGTTYGPVVGGVAGTLAAMGAMYAAQKAGQFIHHQYKSQQYKKLSQNNSPEITFTNQNDDFVDVTVATPRLHA